MIRPTFIERALCRVMPGTALRMMANRAAFEAFSGNGADGAPLSPNNGRWMAVARSANADVVRGLTRQRAESRELCRTNPIAVGAIGTNKAYIVGTGLQPVPTPDLKVLGWTEEQGAAFKEGWLREWSLWSDSRECTWEGNQNFYERQALTIGAQLESGDVFTLLPDGKPTSSMPYRLRLQTLEADRVGNPSGEVDQVNMVAGIRLKDGRPLQAYVYDTHPGGMSLTGTHNLAGQWYDFVGPSGRRRLLHHYNPTRPEQCRGVPYLAPVIQAIKDLGRYTEAEITAAVLSAFYTVFIEQTDSAPAPAAVFGADGKGLDGQNETVPDGGQEIAMGPGAVIGLGKNEKATFANPNRPNPSLGPFLESVMTHIAVGLHMPRELLLKAFNSSYSASRAAMLNAMRYFLAERYSLVTGFCQPVYETLMAEAVAAGRLSAPGFFADPLIRWAYTRATWHGDSAGSLNPKDEVAAYSAAVDARLITRERATWELFGTDWHAGYPAMKSEHQKLEGDGMLPEPKAGAAAPDRNPAKP